MINLGIIGPGLIWQRTHRAILAEMRDVFTVVAYAGRSEESRRQGARAYPHARGYRRADELIADDQVDAVVILTPIELNAPLARAALEAGKPALVEKPVARSAAEGRELFSRETPGTARVYILEQHAYKAMVPLVKRLLEEERIGTPVCFERGIHVHIGVGTDGTGGFGATPWRQHPAFPLGNFFDGGIHEIARLQMIFGPCEAVGALGQSVREGFGDVDQLSMVMRYPRGVQGVLSHSSALGAHGDHFIIHGTHGVIHGDDTRITVYHTGSNAPEVVPVPPHQESVVMWHAIAGALASREPARYHRREALADLAFMDTLQRSLESRCIETIPSEDEVSRKKEDVL